MNKTRKEPKPRSNSNEESALVMVAGGVIEGIGCLAFVAFMIFLWIGLPVLIVGGVSAFSEEKKAELAAESYSIEGVIISTEVIDRPKPEPVTEEEEPKRGIHISINFQSDQFTRVTFQDGRKMDFDGIRSKPIPLDGYVIIEYNGLNRITEIKIPADD